MVTVLIGLLLAFCTNIGQNQNKLFQWQYVPDSKVHGANMGPSWGWQDPAGPHVGPMNFDIWEIMEYIYRADCCYKVTQSLIGWVKNLESTLHTSSLLW